MARVMHRSRRHNLQLKFEESNPDGLPLILFRGKLSSPSGKSRGLRTVLRGGDPLVLAGRQQFSFPAFSLEFRSLLQVYSGQDEPLRRRSYPAEDAPDPLGCRRRAVGAARGIEGDGRLGRRRRRESERVQGIGCPVYTCVQPLGACAPFLAPRAPPKVAVRSHSAEGSGY